MADGGQLGTKSVLFTDLVGSTELRVKLGEEGADELRRVHDALLSDAVTSGGGAVVKGLGDGIMATFDSAADAVAAAVSLQQCTYQHSRKVPAQAFAIRVGVSIGDVSTEEGDVFGVPVVEASRLCSTALGGEILVAELVRALARGRGGFVFEPMGDLELKGLPEPLPTCRVVWEPIVEPGTADASGAAPFPAPLLGSVTAYVGRHALRDRLTEQWANARGGSPRTLLLAGEPGVGKTRTAADVARHAFGEGALVLYGRCDEDLGVPYQPFVEALSTYTDHANEPRLGRLSGELARFIPDLGERFGLSAPSASDAATEEFRLFEATASWLVDAAQNGSGLVFVLDDIHWATKPTLQLLVHSVRAASDAGAPILFVGTYRDTDIDRAHPLAATLSDLRRLPGVERLAVDNLTIDEVLELVTVAAGHDLDADTSRLARAIHAETEGNPFFIAEVLRHLIETGGVRREGERWVVADAEHVAIPEGVRDVVGRRLSRLSDSANEVLTVAAVEGRDFDIAVLAAIGGSEDVALDALDEAVRARLVEETGLDQYRFTHALVRTTLYDELTATRRRRLHRRVADAIEKLRPADVRALAHHCTEGGPDGGDITRALHYTLAAAGEALTARAFADAEARYRSALDLLEDAEEQMVPERVLALCGLGESQRDQSDTGFRETLLEATRLALDAGDPASATRAVIANTRGTVSIVSGVDAERVELIERTLDQLGSVPGPERARLLALLAQETTFSGIDEDRRLALCDEAEELARALRDDDLLCFVLVTLGFAGFSPGRWDHWLEQHREAATLADELGDPVRQVAARIWLSAALFSHDLVEESNRVTDEALAIARDVPPHVRWIAEYQGLRASVLRGGWQELEKQNDELFARGLELGQPDALQWWSATTIFNLLIRGGITDPLVDAAAAYVDQFPQDMTWRTGYLLAAAGAGRLEEVRAQRAFLPAAPTLAASPWPLMMIGVVAIAAIELGDAAYAADLAEVLAPFSGAWLHNYLTVIGPMSWPRGMALSAAGDHDEAVAEVERALGRLVDLGLVTHATRLRVDLARVLRRRNGEGDGARAAALLVQARTEAKEAGSTGLVEKIDALI
jgi:class 3 adenylate cyclase/DNA polymerase III delta prime subunit